jgi:hypothetical protein
MFGEPVQSELPLEKSLPNFDVKRLPTKAQRQLRTLLEGDFLNRKENVLVIRQTWVSESAFSCS